MATEIIIDINNVKIFLLQKEQLKISLRQKEKREIVSALKALKKVWEKYDLEKVYLYGSFADMTFYKYSDVDVAVEPEIPFEDLLRLYSEINRRTKREVDIRALKELPFADKVKKTGVLIYERKNSDS